MAGWLLLLDLGMTLTAKKGVFPSHRYQNIRHAGAGSDAMAGQTTEKFNGFYQFSHDFDQFWGTNGQFKGRRRVVRYVLIGLMESLDVFT